MVPEQSGDRGRNVSGADAESLARQGLELEQHGDFEGAERAYRKADELGHAGASFRLGMVLSMLDDWDGARAAWARAEERGHKEDEWEVPSEPPATPAGGSNASPFANPVLIGAVTVLVLVVGVFLAYTANLGLPFVPTRELKVDLTNGANLVVGNDVREGGYYVGLISSVAPVKLPQGGYGAQLTLKLDELAGPIPLNSHATVLSKSALGLKYLDLIKGTSQRTFQNGATMPVSQTHVPVQIDQVFDMFNQPTRSAVAENLQGFGDTLASRGSALNDTFEDLPPLLGYLRPVAANLSAPTTQLTRLFTTLDTFMRTVAPVAQVNADLFTNMATTFAAIDRSPSALESTIAESPSTLTTSTNSLKVQQPFLVDFTTLGNDLQPATLSLKQALPTINPAIEAGTRTLIRTPSLDMKLQGVMSALKTLARAPGTNVALNALTSTVNILNPMIKYLGPYQTVCDDWNYWWAYLSDHISAPTTFGFAQRVLLNQTNPAQTNNVGSQGATAPVDGGAPNTALGGDEYLHSQQYGAAVENNGTADCETGQRGYQLDLNSFDPQHRQLGIGPHTPGDQGATFAGKSRVPKGETYSRNPTTGPQLQNDPSNP
jgi:virulence factor Mce-like protein